jgi:hypothetical protein
MDIDQLRKKICLSDSDKQISIEISLIEIKFSNKIIQI